MKQHAESLWSLNAADFPDTGSFPQQAKFLLKYATLAPSGHNTQPWLFRILDSGIDVIADRRHALAVVDPYDRELAISCGAAIASLEIAAANFGFQTDVDLSPDPENSDVLARVELTRNGETRQGPDALFDAILKRRTTRAPYSEELPSKDLMDVCAQRAKAFGVDLDFFSEETKRHEIAALVDQGDHIQFDDPAFRRELASWVHSSRLSSGDGMSGTGFGMPDILTPVARFVIRTFDIGDGVGAGNVKMIVDGTPTLAIFSSENDDQDGWVQTGRALGQVLLELTSSGFTSSYLNQPIEIATLRPKLKAQTGVGGYPQILIRVGKVSDIHPPTARRGIDEVIL